jgi:microcystin-dependent protein
MLMPPGALMPYAGSTAPWGYLICGGQAVSRTLYAKLFSVIGTTYGAGNGSTTFNLPDLRGRTTFGLDNMNGTDAGRLSVTNALGGSGGAQTKNGSTASYALTIADIPSHTHDANLTYGVVSSSSGSGVVHNTGTTGNRVNTKSAGLGGGHSHDITNFDVMPPYILMNYLIKV